MKTKKIGKWVSFTLLILLILVFLFPYYVMITGAFKSQMALQLIPPDLNPFRNLTGKNAAYVWQKTEILLWLANSTAVSLGTAIITVFIGATAGICFRKKKIPGAGAHFCPCDCNHASAEADASDTQLSCGHEASSDKFKDRLNTDYRISCIRCVFMQAVYGKNSDRAAGGGRDRRMRGDQEIYWDCTAYG